MSHFTIARSPYGNFAVQTTTASFSRATSAYRFTPIGELNEVPLTDGYVPLSKALDHDALRAEGERQREARSESTPSWLNPSPEYTVNRVAYDKDFTIETWDDRFTGEPVHHVSTIWDDLTASAKTKLASWWNKHQHEVVTPEFLAQTRLESARYGQSRAAELAQEAAKALAAAEQKLTEAGDEVLAALSELHALNASSRA